MKFKQGHAIIIQRLLYKRRDGTLYDCGSIRTNKYEAFGQKPFISIANRRENELMTRPDVRRPSSRVEKNASSTDDHTRRLRLLDCYGRFAAGEKAPRKRDCCALVKRTRLVLGRSHWKKKITGRFFFCSE